MDSDGKVTVNAEQRRDAELGMRWWNGLPKAARALWLDRAWKRAAPVGRYTLESMPSAADAWAEFKRAAPGGVAAYELPNYRTVRRAL